MESEVLLTATGTAYYFAFSMVIRLVSHVDAAHTRVLSMSPKNNSPNIRLPLVSIEGACWNMGFEVHTHVDEFMCSCW